MANIQIKFYEMIIFIISMLIISFGVFCFMTSQDTLGNNGVNTNTQFYSLKSYSGIFFEINNEKKYIGGTEAKSGSDCQVFVYNVTQNKMEETFAVKGSTSVWAFFDLSGTIYFGSVDDAALFSYSKNEEEFKKICSLNEKGIYDITGNEEFLYLGAADKANFYIYNIKTEELTVTENISKQNMIRSVSVLNTNCYLGFGTNAEFVEFNLSNHTYRDILPQEYSNDSFVYDQIVVNEKIILFLSPSYRVLLYDPTTQTFTELINDIRKLRPVSNINDEEENTLINALGYLFSYNEAKQTLSLVFSDDLYIVNTSNYNLEGVTRSGIYKNYKKDDLELKKDFLEDLTKIPIIPTELLAYNDKIYIPDRRFTTIDFSYNKSYSSIISSEPQASVTSSKGIYTANYTEATIWFYPYNILNDRLLYNFNLEDKEKFLIGKIEEEQLRPYMMDISGDEEMVAIVTGPQYGKFGGAVSFYNINADKLLYTQRNIVKNHTLMSVVFDKLDDNYVYIGTYANGENTAQTLEEDAHIVKWNIAERSISFDVVLERDIWKIPDMEITETDLYCISSAAHLFRLNSKNGKILNSNLQDGICEIVLGNNNVLYGISNTTLFEINKETLKTKILQQGYTYLTHLTIDKKTGDLYFFNDTVIQKYDIKD